MSLHKLLFVLLVGWAFVSTAQARPIRGGDVELLFEGEELAPSTTLELRFAREMVAREELGVPVEKPPLVIEPRLPGAFTWLSRRSGVFVPSEMPAMGATYTLTLPPDLRDATGKAAGAGFKAVLKTRAFGLTAWPTEPSDALAPLAPIRLAFNREVKAEGAEKHFRLVNEAGEVAPLTVRYATGDDFFQLTPLTESWEHQWRLAHGPPPDAPLSDADYERRRAEPQRNRLMIVPSTPLTPGHPWRLEMKPGLETLAGGNRIAQAQSFALGTVQPFAITSVLASSYRFSGKSVVLHFSQPMGPDVSSETAAKFFKITPPAKNLRYEDTFQSLTIRGEFDRATEYRVEVDPSLLADSGLPFSGERIRTFRFDPIKPRVFLPAITGHQILSGQRKFPVSSINVKSLRVTARLVAPERASQAVAAFAKYEKEWDEKQPDESYQALPAGAIPGKVIYTRDLELAAVIDAPQETVLDWTEILGGIKAGVVFVTAEGAPAAEAGGKSCGAQALVQITDLGLLWKKTSDRLQVSVFSMATGKAVPGVALSMLDETFRETQRAQSDAAGAGSLVTQEAPGWLLARLGGDLHAVRMGDAARELPMAAFRLPIFYAEWGTPEIEAPSLRAMIFTDRPLYRPGETVRVKGIVRTLGPKGLAPERKRAATLTLSQPQQKGDRLLAVETDERGAFDTEIVLDAYLVGGYGLSLKCEGSEGSWHTSFQAAEFQPNAFELTVGSPSRFAPGAPVKAEIAGKYFFGGALAASPLRWTLQYAGQAFAPSGFEEFVFGESAEEERKPLVLRGEGALSKTGTFTLQPKLPEPEAGPARGVLTVEVTDANQQTVSDTRMFERDSAGVYVGLQMPSEQIVGENEEVIARAIAVAPAGQPVTEPAPVKLELVRVRYHTVRVKGAGKGISFHTEKAEEIVASAEGRTLAPFRQGDRWTLTSGESARFRPAKAGEYLLRARGQDAHGRASTAAVHFTVTGKDPASWDYRHPAQVDLLTDKPEYRPGEKARLMVKAPFSGEAIVSIERDARILRTQRVRLEGNAPSFEVPLQPGDAPNVFVSMVLLRGAEESTRQFKVPEYRYGVCQLNIVDPATRLELSIATRAATVEPGDEIAAEVQVRDGNGAPVPNAEVTFYAVDDGILALTGYERPMPQRIFGEPLPLRVRTGLTLFELLPEDPAALEFANKGYLIGGGGLDGPGPKLRRNFPGTAAWFPKLTTNREGKVTATFAAPDALTRYRLVAVAHAGGAQFASAESSVAITKKLILLSGLGQTGRAGDELLARAVVRNESGRDGAATVALELDGHAEAATGALTAKLELKNGEAKTIDFPLRLKKSGPAEWKWSAVLSAGGESFDDHLAAPLRIGPAGPVLRETYLTELSAKTNDLLAGVNPQLLEGTGAVRVTLANTRLAGLREPAQALLTYPYGCAEQLLSALMPWAVVRELGPVLPDLGKSEEEMEETIRLGVEKFFSLQTTSGGLSYWPGGRASLFPSAYALLVLSLLDPEGENQPGGWDRLVEYVTKELRGMGTARGEPSLEDFALAVFALARAGAAEPGYHEQLFARRGELSLEGRALLAAAMAELKAPPATIAGLLDPRAAAPEALSWFGSPTRERAARLMAWSLVKPADREVGRLVQELLAARVNGQWRTTQENAWALLALARYFKNVEKEVKPVSGQLVSAQTPTLFALSKTRMSKAVELAFAPAQPLGRLEASNPQKAPLYGQATFVVEPPVAEQPRQERGYTVARAYRKLASDGKLQEVRELSVGDRILVTLSVSTTAPGHFVAIDDPLPSILEAVNPEFRAQAVAGGEGLPQTRAADYREIRADRVLYFCDHLPAGSHIFQYLARVRTAGKVLVPGLKVEEMYRPERFGMSATDRLESNPVK